jgi:hypothetical protein
LLLAFFICCGIVEEPETDKMDASMKIMKFPEDWNGFSVPQVRMKSPLDGGVD